jgi:hypothetical protein
LFCRFVYTSSAKFNVSLALGFVPTNLPAALASLPFGFVLVRVRVAARLRFDAPSSVRSLFGSPSWPSFVIRRIRIRRINLAARLVFRRSVRGKAEPTGQIAAKKKLR